MALSPSSSIPQSILAPTVLAIPRGVPEVGGAGDGDAAMWAFEGAIRVARDENQQLRAAIARVTPYPQPPTLNPQP